MNTKVPKLTRKCPDCEGALQRIRMLDATEPGWTKSGSCRHVTLGYAATHAEASWFTGAVTRMGDVCGYICCNCDRIFLYGEAAQ